MERGKASKTKQLSLKDALPLASKERGQMARTLNPPPTHGGYESKGRRKSTRPFYAKAPMHIVLRSKRARGAWSMQHRKHSAKITAMIYVYADRFKVRVYRAANVGNHLHLLVKADDRKNLADFLRVLAGRIAVTVSGAKRGIKKIGKFWDYLCWSRLVNWGRDFYNCQKYVLANELEGLSLTDGKFYRELVLAATMWSNDSGARYTEP